MHWKLFQLFDNWFGQRFICAADSNVVGQWFIFPKTLNFNPFPYFRFPFGTKNPSGYFMAFILSCIIIACEFLVTSTTLSLAIGSYLVAISNTRDLKGILRFIKRQTQIDGIQLKCLKKFEQFIHLHSTAKQLSRELNLSQNYR